MNADKRSGSVQQIEGVSKLDVLCAVFLANIE